MNSKIKFSANDRSLPVYNVNFQPVLYVVATFTIYLRYYISKAEFINANDAKIACQARGKHWDLAIIEDKQEHSFLNKKLSGCVPYWVGMTNPTGSELKDHQGNDVTFANWDTHLGIALEIFFSNSSINL